jgi:hypothetical protein
MRNKLLAVALLALAAPALTFASACVQAKLDVYIGLGSTGCEIGDKRFYNFQYLIVTAQNAVGITADNITVSPDAVGDLGVVFGAGWGVIGPGAVLDFQIQYAVTVYTGTDSIIDAHLDLGGVNITGQGAISAAEDLCLGGTFDYTQNSGNALGIGCDDLGETLLKSDPNGLAADFTNGYSDSVVFAPVKTVGAFKDVFMTAITNGSQAVFSNMSQEWSQTTSQIPEPATYGMIGAGLVALGVIRRKLQK